MQTKHMTVYAFYYEIFTVVAQEHKRVIINVTVVDSMQNRGHEMFNIISSSLRQTTLSTQCLKNSAIFLSVNGDIL